MGKREVGLAGGIAAASAVGAARFADDCALSGARMAASGMDDTARVGARGLAIEGGAVGAATPEQLAARSLADDAARARVGGPIGGTRVGVGTRGVAIDLHGEQAGRALGHTSVESRVGHELASQGAEQALESSIELLGDDDAHAAKLDPSVLDGRERVARARLLDDVDRLAGMLAATKPPRPLVILASSDDGGTTVIARDAQLDTRAIHRDCLAHGVRCVVVTCPPAGEECSDDARAAWTVAIEQSPQATVDELLAGFYVELAHERVGDVVLSRLDRNLAGAPVAVVTRVR